MHDTISDALFIDIYQRHLEIYRKSPTERYLDLITKYPEIMDIVTLREIASYLLVTPIYLSRIRKKLGKWLLHKLCFTSKSYLWTNFAEQKKVITTMARLFISIFLFTTILSSMAQGITGNVVDENNTPLDFVNVVLINKKDSAVVESYVGYIYQFCTLNTLTRWTDSQS